MVADKGVNITDVETKIKGIESLRSSLRFSMTKAQIDGRNLLSDEQLEKIGSLRT